MKTTAIQAPTLSSVSAKAHLVIFSGDSLFDIVTSASGGYAALTREAT